METTQVLCMNGGTGKHSYANNSSLQRKAIEIAKPMIEEAIKDVYQRLLPKSLCISDMGCSSGPNTLYAISVFIEAAINSAGNNIGVYDLLPEFLIHLNDLPNNDFNTIFKYLPEFQEDLKEKMGSGFGYCFLSGLPGSFYTRLLPPQTLHFVHSSYSLHWLSRVPKGVENNKGNIYISSTSPSNVADAYLKQFKKDISVFLKCRVVELVSGGCMVLTIIGRRSEDPAAVESQGILAPLSQAIADMVNEGLIEEDKLNSFNFPKYFPSVSELKAVIEEEGSFKIRRIGLADVHWNVDDLELYTPELLKNAGLNVAKTVRAISEPLLVDHFGEHVANDILCRSAKILGDCMSKRKTKFHNITLSLRKKD